MNMLLKNLKENRRLGRTKILATALLMGSMFVPAKAADMKYMIDDKCHFRSSKTVVQPNLPLQIVQSYDSKKIDVFPNMEVVYAQPFEVLRDPSIDKRAFRNPNPYLLSKEIDLAHERYQGITEENSIISDKGSLYRPVIKQFLYSLNGQSVKVFVALLDQQRKVAFKSEAGSPTQFLDGIYYYPTAEHKGNDRHEAWVSFDGSVRVPITVTNLLRPSIAGNMFFPISPPPQLPTDFVNLKASVDAETKLFKADPNNQSQTPSIIFMGRARVGKDALAYAYLGESFNVTKIAGRFEMNPLNRRQTLEVLHSGIGSRSLGSYILPDNTLILRTALGIQGNENPLDDVGNVLRNHLLLSSIGSFQVCYVIKADLADQNVTSLVEQFNELSQTFDADDLKGISLIFSMACDTVDDARSRLVEIFRDHSINSSFKPGAKKVLEYFANNLQAVGVFKKPTIGHYQLDPQDREGILSVVKATGYRRYSNSGQIGMNFSQRTQDYFQKEIVSKMKPAILNYLEHSGYQLIINEFIKRMRNSQGSSFQIRSQLEQFTNTFNNCNTLADFINKYIDVTGDQTSSKNHFLSQFFDGMKYLKDTLRLSSNDLEITVDELKSPITKVMDLLRTRVQAPLNPKYDPATGALTLVGQLLGESDKITSLNHKNITGPVKAIQTLSTTGHIFDDSHHLEGLRDVLDRAPLAIRSTQNSVVLKYTGHSGQSQTGTPQPGSVGLPGNPGENGANVDMRFGECFNFSNNNNGVITPGVELDTSGGDGGTGGSGGNGTPSLIGQDEVYPKVNPSPTSSDVTKVGEKFSFSTQKNRIARLIFYHGLRVHGIEVQVRSGRDKFVTIGRAGGFGPNTYVYEANPDEYFTGFEGHGPNEVYQITGVHTNKGPFYATIGCIDGATPGKDHHVDHFIRKTQNNQEIIAITGSIGWDGPREKPFWLVLKDLQIISGSVIPQTVQTDGGPGVNAGVGGAAGIPGNPGICVIEGIKSPSDVTITRNTGAPAQPGPNGTPTSGAQNGRLHGVTNHTNNPTNGAVVGVSPTPSNPPAVQPSTALVNSIDQKYEQMMIDDKDNIMPFYIK